MSEAAKVRHIGAGGGGFYLPTCDVAYCGVRRAPGVTIAATRGNCPECLAAKAAAMQRPLAQESRQQSVKRTALFR